MSGKTEAVEGLLAFLNKTERTLAERETELSTLRSRLAETEKLASQLKEMGAEDRAEIEKLKKELAEAERLRGMDAVQVADYAGATKAIEEILVKLRMKIREPSGQEGRGN